MRIIKIILILSIILTAMTFVGVELNPIITTEEIYGGFMIFSFFFGGTLAYAVSLLAFRHWKKKNMISPK
jgi:hypothetical protein